MKIIANYTGYENKQSFKAVTGNTTEFLNRFRYKKDAFNYALDLYHNNAADVNVKDGIVSVIAHEGCSLFKGLGKVFRITNVKIAGNSVITGFNEKGITKICVLPNLLGKNMDKTYELDAAKIIATLSDKEPLSDLDKKDSEQALFTKFTKELIEEN